MLSLSKIWTLPSRGQCWVYFTGSDVVPLLLLAGQWGALHQQRMFTFLKCRTQTPFTGCSPWTADIRFVFSCVFRAWLMKAPQYVKKNLGRGKGGAHRWTTAVPWVYWLCQNVTSFLHGNSCLFARKILHALTTWSWQLLRCADVNSAL